MRSLFIPSLCVAVCIHPCIISISFPIMLAAVCLSRVRVCTCMCVLQHTPAPGESVIFPTFSPGPLAPWCPWIFTPMDLFLSPQNWRLPWGWALQMLRVQIRLDSMRHTHTHTLQCSGNLLLWFCGGNLLTVSFTSLTRSFQHNIDWHCST